jgi:hypothetical protein
MHVNIEFEREKSVSLVFVILPRVDLTTTTRKLRVTSRGVCAWKTTQYPVLEEKVATRCLWPAGECNPSDLQNQPIKTNCFLARDSCT